MADNIYNKGTKLGRGTLVGNWQEEETMRDVTGEGRTIPRVHIEKKWGDLEKPILHDKKFDDTGERIHGDRRLHDMTSENYHYGKSKNPADELPRVGKRTLAMEREIQEQVRKELEEKAAEEERIRNMRYFDSTAKTTFVAQDLQQNTVGKRVMKTQDGQTVGNDPALNMPTMAELMNRIPQGDYTQTQPVTIYTEALENKNFYMSAATGANPFGKTSGFT